MQNSERRKRKDERTNQWNNGWEFFSTDKKINEMIEAMSVWTGDKECKAWSWGLGGPGASLPEGREWGRVPAVVSDPEVWLVTRHPVPGDSWTTLQLEQKCKSKALQGQENYGCHWTQSSLWHRWHGLCLWGSSGSLGSPWACPRPSRRYLTEEEDGNTTDLPEARSRWGWCRRVIGVCGKFLEAPSHSSAVLSRHLSPSFATHLTWPNSRWTSFSFTTH